MLLIAFKYVSRIYFLNYIVQAVVISVGDYGLAFFLKYRQAVYDLAAVEGCTVFQGWLVNDDLGAFGLDSFHYPLD